MHKVIIIVLVILLLVILFFYSKKSKFASQLGADDWVLTHYDKNDGYFVDVGCADGEDLSNTYKLDHRGWKGICIDAFPKNFGNRPNSIIETAVLADVAGKEVEFAKYNTDENLSGIKDKITYLKDIVLTENSDTTVEKFTTQTLGSILEKHGAPSFIEYMSLDVEGGEYDILKTFDFNKYTFGVITIEHNYQEPIRTDIMNLLKEKGYTREKEVQFDDWYVKNK